ncbi:hypothetical protein ACFE04_005799 [Oxalis oulophora]
MGQRNNLCPNNQMHNLDMTYFHPPQPCFQLGGVSTIIQPNFHPAVAVSVNGTTSYEGPHHLPPSIYAPYMAQPQLQPPVPVNYGSSDHSTSVNVGAPADSEGGSHKTKHAEGNSQNVNVSASSSSAVVPAERRHHTDGANVASYGVPQNIAAHNYYPMLQGTYMGQPFTAPSGVMWFDPQASCRDGLTSAWNTPVPARPYMHGNNIIGGSMDTMGINGPRYHETANNITSANFMAPPINLRHPNIPPAVTPLPGGLTGHSVNYLPPIAGAAYRHPTTYVRSTPLDGMNMGPTQPLAIPSPGLGIFRPPLMAVVPPEVQAALRTRSLPHFRVLPSDVSHISENMLYRNKGVAMLELPNYYQMSVDHHRDMRLDIEHMSYEELLALEERIGSVNTGLSEETVGSQLKTRTYSSSAPCINASGPEQVSDSCIICQEEYKNQEELGILTCGHDYHADCLTKWLLSKNDHIQNFYGACCPELWIPPDYREVVQTFGHKHAKNACCHITLSQFKDA